MLYNLAEVLFAKLEDKSFELLKKVRSAGFRSIDFGIVIEESGLCGVGITE